MSEPVNRKTASVITTVEMQVRSLDADAVRAFASLLDKHEVRGSAPVEVHSHLGQRDQVEAVTMRAVVVHG